jgi:hypothetical protein
MKCGCMDIDTQFQEVKEHTKETVEEVESNDGSKCTKINISEKGPSTFKKYY